MPKIKDIIIKDLGIKELSEWNHLTPEPRKQRYISIASERFKKGNICMAAKHLGRVIAISWLSQAKEIYISEVETKINIDKNSVLIFDCVTIPEYQRKHIYSFLLQTAINRYINSKKIIYCRDYNIASKKGIEANCFNLVRKLYLLKILGVKLRWIRKCGLVS